MKKETFQNLIQEIFQQIIPDKYVHSEANFINYYTLAKNNQELHLVYCQELYFVATQPIKTDDLNSITTSICHPNRHEYVIDLCHPNSIWEAQELIKRWGKDVETINDI